MIYRCRKEGVTSLKTVYIGGGTPSLLTSVQLTHILDTLREISTFTHDAEITMEANPADINADMLSFLEKAGINRLSVGIQSVDQVVLTGLGRRSDAGCVEKVLKLLESEWLAHNNRLSLDLIAGLPGLSDDAFERGVERVIATGADHISLYALMIEEGTRLEQQVRDGSAAYSDEDNDRQWIRGRDMLVSEGYAQYEVSNFARPGFESRHNTVYWHMQDYLGTGAGGTGTVGAFRWTETTDLCSYMKWWNGPEALKLIESLSSGMKLSSNIGCSVEKASEPPAETEILDDETREFEFLMMGFRLLEGVSSREYGHRFGKSLAERIGADASVKADNALPGKDVCNADNSARGLFLNWKNRGLACTFCTKDGDTRYALTAEGILLLNQFLEALL